MLILNVKRDTFFRSTVQEHPCSLHRSSLKILKIELIIGN